MTEPLKPCPFCGESAMLEDNHGREFWVQCYNDHSDGKIYQSIAEAEAAWNQRA